MEYSSDMFPFATTWMALEGVTPSEVSQTKCDLTYACNLKNNAHRTDGTRTQTQSRRGRAAATVGGVLAWAAQRWG